MLGPACLAAYARSKWRSIVKEDMETEDKRRLASTHRTPGVTAFRECLAFGCLMPAFFFGGGMAPVSSPAPFVPEAFVPEAFSPARRDPFFITVQGTPSPLLPSLVLPPDATAGPAPFAALMRQGDSAMLHGNVAQARAFYERAATAYRESPAAPLALGKTFDPNILSPLGASSGFADPAVARAWYGRARALGDPAAAELLARLP